MREGVVRHSKYTPYDVLIRRSSMANSSIIEELSSIHRKICQLPSGDDLRQLFIRIHDLTPKISVLVRSPTSIETRTCRDLLWNIRVIAKAAADADQLVSQASTSCLNQLDDRDLVKAIKTNNVGLEAPSCTPQHDPYCLWFLNHLSYPYPSPKDCKLLLEQVPSETISQLRTWFTNTRRRSGWSDLYKKYTDGNASKMSKLLDAIHSPLEQTPSLLFDVETIEEAKADLEAVKEYFGRSEERKKVSSWINDSIEKTKHLPTAVIRTPSSSPASSDKSSPPTSPTPSPTRKRGRKNAKPLLYAKPNIPVFDTDDIPVIAPQMTLIDPMW